MSTNPFFSHTPAISSEQSLLNDLQVEFIKMFGVDLHYLPRLNNHLDYLFQESPLATFEIASPIAFFIQSFDGYSGPNDILTKFGIRNQDELTVICSRQDFEQELQQTLSEYYEIKNIDVTDPHKAATIQRPKEGDLIYLPKSPFDHGFFVIKYVEWRNPWYPLGTTNTFTLTLERFEYSGEKINILVNPIDEINTIIPKSNYQRFAGTLQVGGSGTFDLNTTVYIHPNQTNFTNAVTAQIFKFNSTNRTFEVGLLSNFDPEVRDGNTFDSVWRQYNNYWLSNSDRSIQWRITTLSKDDQVVDDDRDIQNVFDELKIIDLNDQNDFGFF
jgi:hypothetical protein